MITSHAQVNVVTGRRTATHLLVDQPLTVNDMVAAHPAAFCQSPAFFTSLYAQTKISPSSLYYQEVSRLVGLGRISL